MIDPGADALSGAPWWFWGGEAGGQGVDPCEMPPPNTLCLPHLPATVRAGFFPTMTTK